MKWVLFYRSQSTQKKSAEIFHHIVLLTEKLFATNCDFISATLLLLAWKLISWPSACTINIYICRFYYHYNTLQVNLEVEKGRKIKARWIRRNELLLATWSTAPEIRFLSCSPTIFHFVVELLLSLSKNVKICPLIMGGIILLPVQSMLWDNLYPKLFITYNKKSKLLCFLLCKSICVNPIHNLFYFW